MPVTIEKLNMVIKESKRFIEKAELAKERIKSEGEYLSYSGCKETGAVKRASLDLSDKLIELRK